MPPVVTVKYLIEFLQGCNPDAAVLVDIGDPPEQGIIYPEYSHRRLAGIFGLEKQYVDEVVLLEL